MYFIISMCGLLLLILIVAESATHPVGFRIWNTLWDKLRRKS